MEYEGFTAEIPISVTSIVLDNLIVTTGNTFQKEYFVGDEFDPTGMEITATYTYGPDKEIDLSDCELNVTGTDGDKKFTEAGTQTITVTYTEDGISKSDTVTVNVKQRSHSVTIKIANECREQGTVMYRAEFAVFDKEYTIKDVMPDDSITFSVQAKEGYSVDKVVSDQRGELLSTSSGPTDPKYTLTDVTKNETVTVYFKAAK